MNLLAKMRRYAARHALWRPETRVVAAVSGGSDSVAMFRLLHELDRAGALQLDAIAHLNHQIRPEADDDEQFVRLLAQSANVAFYSERLDVRRRSASERQSIEVTARNARRSLFDTVMRERGAAVVALAHTADDQAETVLMRVLRGAGTRGLGGIAPRSGRRIRPVLFATRRELQAFLIKRGQKWCEDATNADIANPRNRVRHELLPSVRRHFNPSITPALARLADVARAEDAWLARQAAAAAVDIIRDAEDGVRIDRDRLLGLPEALARRVLQYGLVRAGCERASGLLAVDALLEVARGTQTACEIFNLRGEHSSGFVVLTNRQVSRREPFRLVLPIPGEVRLRDLILSAQGPFPATVKAIGRGDEVTVAADDLAGGLIVRSRQPGDRLRPLGLGGGKKVQDLLVDRKVNRIARDCVPIVTDTKGRIVWVAGHAIGEEFRVTDASSGVIILKLLRV